MRVRIAPVLIGLLVGGMTACTTQVAYPGYGEWGPAVTPLGPVAVCRGAFCDASDEGTQGALALNVPPDAATYHAALRDKAAMTYAVPRDEVVLGEVRVELVTEVVGTVRGWRAAAHAGRTTAHTSSASPDTADRLRQLDALRDAGLISADEYRAARQRILDGL